MIAALVLLTRLRLAGVFRKWRRSLRRPKGLLVTIVLGLIIVPWFGFLLALPFFTPPQPGPTANLVERFGPLALFGMTAFSLITSSGEMTLYFSPAEIDFLFAGPYTRRQLIGYKLILALLSTTSSALLFALIGSSGSTRFGSAFLGLVLVLMLFQLTQIIVGLGLNVLGTLAWNRLRRGVLVGVFVVVAVAVWPSRSTLEATDWKAVAMAVEGSPVTRVLLTPFSWFVRTVFAGNLAAFVQAAIPALLVDLGLVGLVFALDAGYLEVAAAASARRLARVQKLLRGGGTIATRDRRRGWLRWQAPDPPWWGGVGPHAWRQMVSASADPRRVVILTAIFAGLPYLAGSILTGHPRSQEIFLASAPSVIVLATLFLSLMLAYDFRGDLDVMETLKMLPVRPVWLACGQMLTPTVLATFLQGCATGGLLLGVGGLPGLERVVLLGLCMLFPANLYFFAIENLLFLWYPTRAVAGQFDGAAVIRQLLMLLVKGVALLIAAAWTAGVGGAAYFLSGQRLEPALVAGILALAALALALLPLLGRAFLQFDVTHDIPA